MTLTFNKVNNVYVCEFEVNGDFNLHIEKEGNGSVTMYQRGTPEGGLSSPPSSTIKRAGPSLNV